MQSSSKTNSLVIILSTALVGLAIGVFSGFALGVVIGVNSAFGENDGVSEVTYSDDTFNEVSPYWYVYFNEHKQPTLRSADQSPLKIESALVFKPGNTREFAVPVENTVFNTATARFVQTTEGSFEVLLRTWVQESKADGWPIREYKYRVKENELQLIEVTRSGLPFNEWGGEMVFGSVIFFTFVGTLGGFIVGGVCGITAVCKRRNILEARM